MMIRLTARTWTGLNPPASHKDYSLVLPMKSCSFPACMEDHLKEATNEVLQTSGWKRWMDRHSATKEVIPKRALARRNDGGSL